jgi:sulfite dehydrogenase (quinone) subunit SoeC
MKPALSIILFTTVAGAAQGAAVVLAVAALCGTVPAAKLPAMLWVLVAMLLVALAASFFHLGHPLRAWRAIAMWRTSWMSREVIVLPAFIAWLVLWAWSGSTLPVFAWVTLAGSVVLWYCTAMIYACIRFIQEWAHPLTFVNYVTLGLASGVVVAGVLALRGGEAVFAASLAGWAVAATALAWFTRALSLARNARLKPKSTAQSATGIRAERVVQTSMGFTGGSFNTREFFHGASPQVYRLAKPGFQVFAFAIPLALLAVDAWGAALASQAAGLLAERWFFFAQAQHPQNLYYQAVS